ncbi:MAG: hypothetical protein AAF497_23015, partial [Planctomycetota bacterium]
MPARGSIGRCPILTPEPDSDRWSRIQSLFEHALTLPELERLPFLQESCGDDSDLLNEIQSLLGSFDGGKEELEVSPVARAVNEEIKATAEVPEDAIPGYRLLKELHRGGQGVIYQAIQESTKRKVAVKVLLEGPFAGPASKRRFEREVELVGSLQHPCIVPIFDSVVSQGKY